MSVYLRQRMRLCRMCSKCNNPVILLKNNTNVQFNVYFSPLQLDCMCDQFHKQTVSQSQAKHTTYYLPNISADCLISSTESETKNSSWTNTAFSAWEPHTWEIIKNNNKIFYFFFFFSIHLERRRPWIGLHFLTGQGHCGVCKKKWKLSDSDHCSCGETVRPKRCHTLSNPAHRQDYTVACLNYTLQTMMLLPGWPVMAPNAYDNNNIEFREVSG